MMSALHSALDGFSLRANANTNVRQLARATLCYRSPDCQVTVSSGPWLTHVRSMTRR